VHLDLAVRAGGPDAPPFAVAECLAAPTPCDVDIGVDGRPDIALRIVAHDAGADIRLTVTPLLGGKALGDRVVGEGRPLVVPIDGDVAVWLTPRHVSR
jgi:hypothetical protein